MTETNPEGARPTAGRVGAHRQEFAEPVTDPESLNVAPQRLRVPAEEGGHHQDDVAKVRQDDVAKVRRDIERTRDDLGDTIEALAAKADVRARAREKASNVADRVRSMTPEPVRGAAGRVTEKARQRPGMAAASAGAATTGLIIAWGITRATRSRGVAPALRVGRFGPRMTPARRRRRSSARMGRITRMAPFARTSPMARLAQLMGLAGRPRRGRRIRTTMFS